MYRSMNWRGFVLLIGIILAIFLVFHLIMRNTLNAQSEKINTLNALKTRQEELNVQLRRQLEVVGTDDYIVERAIRDYSYVNRDDIRFEFDNPEALDRYTEAEIRVLVEEMAE